MLYKRAGIGQTENRRANPKQAGFTLIEVMFAVVFLSIGLLGIAAMQDIAISRNVDGRRLTVATNLAAEMLERVRYNGAGSSVRLGGLYLYNGIVACTGATCTGPSTPNPGNTGNISFGVPRTTAAGDYAQWNAALAAVDSNNVRLLPGAVGRVSVSAVDALNPIGTTSLEQVQTRVTVSWTAGLRTPTVTMSSMMTPL